MSSNGLWSARNVRSWTDDQLRAAVAASRSWRDVARALGLQPTSTQNLRRHVARLRLDTTHFTGRRRWSDQQLRAAVTGASSWTEVLRLLPTNEAGGSRLRVRAHAARLGLDVSHLSVIAPQPPPVDLTHATPQPRWLRAAASAIATAWFELRGFATAVPVEPQPYDLLVCFPDGIKRVQVKSSTFRSRRGKWQVHLGHRPYSLDKSASRAPYDPDTLDFFFVVDGAGRLFLIPGRAVAGRVEVFIDTYPQYRVGDAASLLTWDRS